MSIYVKDSILQKFPDIGDEFLPVLFADAGIMPDRRGGGKTKSCYIVANLSGTYFFRSIKLAKLFKVSDFVSIYNVLSIIYTSEKRRTFETRRREVFFECPHVDELVSIVLTIHKQILTGIPDARQIRLVNFPFEPPIAPLPSIGNYSVIRYITSCLQTQDYPYKNIIELIEHADIIHNPRITLDQTHSPPNKLRSLHFPLIYLGKVRIVTMKNFADFVACRFVHFLLKHSNSIDTIIFQDYKCLIPEQLRFEKIIPRKLLSFAFINCQFDPSVLPSMFEEIGKFRGEIQRITFDKVSFTLDSWNSVFESIRTQRPFQTLEILEINNIDSPDVNSDIATNTFINLFKYRRFIMTFSCSFWNNPLSIGFDFYTDLSLIAEINFVSQDFSKPFPNSFRFPVNINLINLNKCLFSVESLKSLFNALLYHDKICISLHLSDIKLQKSELTSFYQSLQSMPPVTCIQELNWSGNRLNYSDIDKFVQYFFKSNKIRSFHIDRIFDYNQINNLRHLFQLIGKNNIWKLSLGGDEQHNFKNNIKHVLGVLDLISPLNIIHFNDQFLTYSDLTDVLDYLKTQSFTEISLDGSALTNEENFFDFYDNILQLQIPIVERPNNDINRLFGENLQKLKMVGRWNKFKSKFQEKLSPLPESGVSFFINKITKDDFFDQVKYIYFLQRFPLVYFKLKDQDPYLLGKAQTTVLYPSLITFRVKKPARRLGDFHSFYLIEPTKIPRYFPSTSFSLPHCFSPDYKPSQPINSKFSININHQQIKGNQQYDTQLFEQQQFKKTENNDEVEKTENNDEVEKTENNDEVEKTKSNDEVEKTESNNEVEKIKSNDEVEKTKSNDEVEKTENKNDDENNCFINEDEKFHKIIDKIGESVSSVLYKIIDTRNQKLMCKKVLKCDPNLVTFKDVKNAVKEFEYLNSIKHPSICHAIGINISEPNPDSNKEQNEEDDDECTTVSLFLEFIDYKLTDCLNQKILNNTLKTKIILEIIHGMAYIHQHGIIHRNLNIDNIMLNLNYDAKIINFAQAKLIECLIDQDSYSMSSMTKNIGSMLFMSPEMMNDDDEAYDNKTDVYSFGLILYYIFDGKLPKYTLNDKVKRKPIPIPNESPVMSNFCLNIITKCVSFDSKDRPSFVEILAELRSNSYLLADGIDQSLIEKRDKELTKIDKL